MAVTSKISVFTKWCGGDADLSSLVDAGCDPDFAFEDLGNAVRKIYIDLGIRITFGDLSILKNRPSARFASRAMRDAAARVAVLAAAAAAEKEREKEEREREEEEKQREQEQNEKVAPHGEPDKAVKGGGKAGKITVPDEPPYYAIGKIDYKHADRSRADNQGDPIENGHILYIKPAYHGTETSAGSPELRDGEPGFSARVDGQPVVHRIAVRELSLARAGHRQDSPRRKRREERFSSHFSTCHAIKRRVPADSRFNSAEFFPWASPAQAARPACLAAARP